MNKTYSMSIRVSEEELNRLKQAAKLESYSSYSEFVRRIALKEADKVIRVLASTPKDFWLIWPLAMYFSRSLIR